MEDIASQLKISELRQQSLCKAYEELHSQASSILVFSLQWKDLETHFGSIRKLIESRSEQLMERESYIASREKELDAKGSELNSKIELKEAHLVGIEKLIEERLRVLKSNTLYVDSLESLIQENCQELEVKGGQCAAILKSIGEKEREFGYIETCVKQGKEKLEVLEKRVKEKSEEAESKEKEIESIRTTLKGYEDEIRLKRKIFNAIQRSIDDCDKEIKEREEKLDSIEECSKELESKQKQLDLLREKVKLKEKILVWLRKKEDQCVEKFVIKEREFEGFLKKLELREKFCESKFEELHSFKKKVNDCLKEVESRDKNLISLQKSVDKLSRELERKEMEFEKKVSEFKLRKRQLDLPQKSVELRAKEKEKANIIHSRLEIEQSESTPINNAIGPLTAINQNFIPEEGKDLQLVLNRHLKRHDFLCVGISCVLRASLDPGKLVLDAMQGFYPSNSSSEGSETFDVNIVRRSCILLLEQLMEASPQINSQVREEALKLAVDWKAKMKVADKNYYEVLGFLQLLASYRLASAFDLNELHSLFDIFGQHKQASKLHQFLCPTVNAPVKIEQAENSLDNVATSSSNAQFSINTMQNNVIPLLQMSPDPAKFVLDSIQGPISEHWKRGDAGFEASVMTDYIFVFEQLFRSLPQIQPFVKEDARKLAVEWKAKLRPNADSSLEILCFLQFLATYGLVSLFSENEILKFLEKISQHKHTLDLCCTLGFAEKIPELIQNLVQRKEVIEAVRFIFAFKLIDKFSPVSLLTKYVEDLKNSTLIVCKRKGKKPIEERVEEKEKATDEEIGALRAVIQTIKDYNLESEFPSAMILERIKQLEQSKKMRRQWAEFVCSNVDEQQKQQSVHCKAVQQQKPSVSLKDLQQQMPSVSSNADQWQEKPSVSPNAVQQQQKPSIHPQEIKKDRRSLAGLFRSKVDQHQKQQSVHRKAIQQQQKPSIHPNAEPQHQKPSVHPYADQQQEKPSVCPNAEQQHEKPSISPSAEQQQQKPSVHPQEIKEDMSRSAGLVHSKVDQHQKQQSVHHKVIQQQQKPLVHPNAEQQQKPSVHPYADQQQEKASICPNADQQQENPLVCPNAEQHHQQPSVYAKAEQQHQQQWKKRRNDYIAYHHSPPQGNHKFPRTSASTSRSRGPPVFTHIVAQPLEFPPRMHEPDMEFAGDPRQFDFVAANGHIVSPNVGAGGLRARMPPYVGARRRNAGMPPNVGAGWPNAGMPY